MKFQWFFGFVFWSIKTVPKMSHQCSIFWAIIMQFLSSLKCTSDFSHQDLLEIFAYEKSLKKLRHLLQICHKNISKHIKELTSTILKAIWGLWSFCWFIQASWLYDQVWWRKKLIIYKLDGVGGGPVDNRPSTD